MIENIVNLFSKTRSASNVQSTSIVRRRNGNNPFANPFVNSNNEKFSESYAKNTPVKGGYFAGYYNNKPNIVGQRLFVEA